MNNMKEALYSAPLKIGSIELQCYILAGGTRLLSATSVFEAFGKVRKGRRSEKDRTYFEQGAKKIELPVFMPLNILQTRINQINLTENAEKQLFSKKLTLYWGGPNLPC